jgi:hypothetical protein
MGMTRGLYYRDFREFKSSHSFGRSASFPRIITFCREAT